MKIKEAVEQWQWRDDFIRVACEKLQEKASDIEQEIDYEPELNYPELREDIVKFHLQGDILYTEWEYIDGYESICDSQSSWAIPLEWFEMSKEELREVLVQQALEKVENDRKFAIDRLKYEAEFYGLKVSTH